MSVYSSFFGIELGKRALITQQLALHTIAHNISNANTPGYSRQITSLGATPSFFIPDANHLEVPGQLGSGVKIDSILRARDMLLERQIQQETTTQGACNAKSSYFDRVNAIIDEHSNQSVGQALDDFWAAWQELSSHPEDMAVRNTLISKAQRLTSVLQTKDQDLQGLQKNADDTLRADADKINQLASQIRDVNVRINQCLGIETAPNDLLDQRDKLMSELSKLADVQGHQMPNGLYDITINGHTLVQDAQFIPITAVNDPLNSGYAKLTWSDDGTDVQVQDGEVKGLLDIRDANVPLYRQALDSIAQGLMANVNPVQSAGYGLNAAAPSGLDFFTGSGIQNIAVNPTLINDPTQVAAASNPNAPGDGSNALAQAQLQNSLSMSAGSLTFGQFYQGLVAQVGLDGQQNSLSQDGQNTLVDSLEQQRDSVSGVNLDEEMTDLIKYQNGYQAAVRVISTMDSMLNTIINQMGAGR